MVTAAEALQKAAIHVETGWLSAAEEICWMILAACPGSSEANAAKNLLRSLGIDPDGPSPRRLHIGGKARRHGWTVIDAVGGPHVDVIGNITDMSIFPENYFSVVYVSHVLEHLEPTSALPTAISEIYRVLSPGGKLLVSVPDIERLSRCLANMQMTDDQECVLLSMMFGDHSNPFDGHKLGFTFGRLRRALEGRGFCDVTRVEQHRVFPDSSEQRFGGVLISINVIAAKQ